MKNILRSVLVVLAAVIVTSCTTTGGSISDIKVAANRSNKIGFVSVATKYGSCKQPGKLKMDVVKAPEHGNVRFEWTRGKSSGVNARCGVVYGMAIIYTPDRGYRGPDNFKIGTRYPTYVQGTTTSRYATDNVSVVVR